MAIAPAAADQRAGPLADPVQLAPLDGEALARYARDGYLGLRGALASRGGSALVADVLAVLRARNVADSYLAQSSEYLAGGAIDRLMHSPRLGALATQLLEGSARLYLPFTAVKGPGQGRFTFQQDNSYTRLDGPACNCWFALSDATRETGCLRMVPGSHLAGTISAEASQECPGHRQVAEPLAWDEVVMRAGDCVVFSRLTVHGSGPNRAPQRARGICRPVPPRGCARILRRALGAPDRAAEMA